MKPIRRAFCAALLVFAAPLYGVEMLNVPQRIWDGLQPTQRENLGGRFVVNVLSGTSYGTILDAQTLNESTPGTTAGSQLGAAYGSAAYVDRAFSGSPRNWNYSATNNITAAVVGGLLGSLADKAPQARFRTRYTVKTGDGAVIYLEESKSDAFRHSTGLCMALSPLRPLDFDACNMSLEQFVTKYNLVAVATSRDIAPRQSNSEHDNVVTLPQSPATERATSSPSVPGDLILCKFGLATPVRISKITCEGANGSVLP